MFCCSSAARQLAPSLFYIASRRTNRRPSNHSSPAPIATSTSGQKRGAQPVAN